MDRELQQRLQWVKMYEDCGDTGLARRRYGISRPTIRKYKLYIVADLERKAGSLIFSRYQDY